MTAAVVSGAVASIIYYAAYVLFASASTHPEASVVAGAAIGGFAFFRTRSLRE